MSKFNWTNWIILFYLVNRISLQLTLNIDATKSCQGYFFIGLNNPTLKTTGLLTTEKILSLPLTFNRPLPKFINYSIQNITGLKLVKSICYKSTFITNPIDQIVLENNIYSFVFFIDPTSSIIYTSEDQFISRIFQQSYQSNRGINIFQDSSNSKYIIYYNNPISVNFLDNLTASQNNCTQKSVTASNNLNNYWSNCIDINLGIPNSSWFKNNIRYNYALWFTSFLLIFYFIWTLSIEEVLPINSAYENNNLTIHPIYSIFCIGSDIFTRNSRITSLLISLVTSMFMISLMNFIFIDGSKLSYAGQIPVFILLGIIFSFFFNYFNGYLLKIISKVHINFINSIAKCETYNVRKNIEEQYLNRLEAKKFIFYFINLILFFVLTSLSVYFVNYKTRIDTISSVYYLIEVLGAWFIDIAILDTIVAFLLTKNEKLKNIFAFRGFYYDYKTHAKYLEVEFEAE